MEDLPPQLFLLAKQLLSAIQDFKEAVQEQTKAVSESTKTTNRKQSLSPEIPLHAEVNLPQGVEIRKRAADAQDDRHYQNRTLLVAALTLAAVVIYAYISGGQLSEMRKATVAATNAANTARDALVLDERAWMGVQGTQSEEFSIASGFIVTVVFANSGKTPAHNVQSSVGYKTSPIPVPGPTKEDIAALEFRPTQSVAPQSKYNMTLGKMAAGEGATPHQMEGSRNLLAQLPDIQKGNLILYYYGILKYDDIFKTAHETQFCIYLADPKTKRVGVCDAFNDLN